MSIDLFFIGAAFVVKSARELAVYRNRVIAALLIAGACFLLIPLRFAFPRPPVAGAIGAGFELFRKMDLPFNQFPSLHVAFWLILMDVYPRHLRGAWRWA